MLEAVFLFHDPHMNTETEKVVFGRKSISRKSTFNFSIKAITVKNYAQNYHVWKGSE